ncbi:hypothetical protein [Cohnella sp. CFH 77786]|uniref:hypothetical protein n=1 Tax=Cohnella sp. CFH 77786 TaxID=2662265 RepID=UPI00351D903C
MYAGWGCLRDIGIHEPKSVRDLWQRIDLGMSGEHLEAYVPPHGAKLFRLRDA